MDRRLAFFALSVLFYGACSGERSQSTYMGCFEDGSERLLDGARDDSDALTPESCVDFCYRRRFQFAGVEYGKECFCGDSLKGKSRVSDNDCGKQCLGDPTRVCGGEWRIGIYNTGLRLGEAAKNYIYVGCYVDRKERVLNGSSEVSDILTPVSCVTFCYKRDYTFAGMEYGRECFCGNSLIGTEKRPNGECNRQCDGDQTRNCGGAWRLSVYNTGFINYNETATVHFNEDVKNLNAKYIGCYVELSTKARLLRGFKKDFKGRLTNFLCQQYCKDLGFLYAGTQWKMECFCSNKRPSYKSRTIEEECNDKCDGNNLEKCGGSLRISVYDISGSTENPMISNYEGCFPRGETQSLSAVRGQSELMTPEYCTALCYREGFLYGGVHSGNICRCGNNVGNKAADTDCQTPCKGDSALSCGGDDTHVSVYRTAIPPASSKPTNVTYEGCFEDSEERMLMGSAIPTSLLTKSFCVEYCFRKAYRYAGLEYGFECYCGDHLSSHNEVSDNECNMQCTGNSSEKCGSSWRISVYTTGVAVSADEPTATTKPIPTPKPAPPPTSTPPPLSASGPPLLIMGGEEDIQPKPNCEPSETLLYGERLCKGQVLLDEQFDEIDRRRWSHSVYMPEGPDYQFVVYRDEPENVYVKDGVLFIKPTLMDDEVVRKGSILLRKCTGKQGTDECKREAELFNILPPINSGRLHTKDTLAFRYGKVEVRAKLPVGDWIVPEIWLEPKNSEYGEGYASGRIRIAVARGNRQLILDNWELGKTLLETGLLLGFEEDVRGRAADWNVAQDFHDSFHNFTLIWTPDSIGFSVDGRDELKVVNNNEVLRDMLNFKDKTVTAWMNGTSLAPFDQEFYVSLGLSVGGVRDFPDDSMSGDYKKPWKNMGVKAKANFWVARDKWYPTWHDEESALKIDYVKVTAL